MTTKIFKYALGAIVAGAALAACSPDDFAGADANGLPTVSGMDFDLQVDQETNQMVAHYTPVPGTYPIWIVNGTTYSTLQEVGYKNDEAGTYSVELKVGNRNGISQAGIKKDFTFNETKADYSADFRKLCDKEWRMASEEVAHLSCGPAGTAAMEWWSAPVNDKKDFGIYDDRIVFTHTDGNPKGGSFAYNAGADGLTYVNAGTTKWGSGNASDFDATIGNQTSTWSFEVRDWTDSEDKVSKQTYIRLGANTPFPYISSDKQFEEPLFRIEELTSKKLAIIYEAPDKSIAWRMVFTNGELAAVEPNTPVMDWDVTAPANLWAKVESGEAFDSVVPWFADDNWAQLSDPKWSHADGVWAVTLPEGMGKLQWQGQLPIHTKLAAKAGKKYNFYCVLEANADCPGVTIKLTDKANAENFFTADRHDLKADEPYIYKLEGASLSKAADAAALSLVLDFSGSPVGTTVKLSKVYLEEAVTMAYDDAANLWKAVDEGSAFESVVPWFANEGWTQLPNPAWSHEGNKWTVTLPADMGTQQWQGQFPINTTIPAKLGEAYNFSCTLTADADCSGVTIKLTDKADAGSFFVTDRHDIKADEPFVYKFTGLSLSGKADAAALALVFDFAGSPAGTKVVVSDIILEKAQ